MKISIITVCYNSSQFLESAITSVLAQKYSDIEYIVIDGGSDDGTLAILKTYSDRITHVISEPDKGIYDAMNKGLALATGDVIGILNSDDFYPHTNVINEVVSAFESSPLADMVLGNVDFVMPSELNKPVRYYSSYSFRPWKMRFGFMPAHPGAFIKKSAYDEIGKYKLGYQIGADFDMFVRLLLVKKMPYFKLNQMLVRMRVGGISTSGFKSYLVSSKEIMRSLKENRIYSNSLFVLLRLPVKFVQMFLTKFRS